MKLLNAQMYKDSITSGEQARSLCKELTFSRKEWSLFRTASPGVCLLMMRFSGHDLVQELMKCLCIRCKQEFGGVGIKEKEKERKWKDREKLVRPHHAELGLWEGPWQDARPGRVGCFQEQAWPIFNSKKLFAGLGATWPFSSANIHYESVGHTT